MTRVQRRIALLTGASLQAMGLAAKPLALPQVETGLDPFVFGLGAPDLVQQLRAAGAL